MNAIIEQMKDAAASYLKPKEQKQFFEIMAIEQQAMLDKEWGAAEVKEDVC